MAEVKLLSGHTMPTAALGTWRSERAVLKAAIGAALSADVRHLDCARLYANEDVVGEAVVEAIQRGVVTRAELFITSKLPPNAMHEDAVEAALDASLSELRTSYLDLYILHWPTAFVRQPSAFPVPFPERLGYDAARVLAVWRVLERAVASGKVRSLGASPSQRALLPHSLRFVCVDAGVSNFSTAKLQALLDGGLEAPCCCNQLEVHPYLSQRDVVRWHAERGIVVTCYCPLASPARPPTCHFEEDPVPLLSASALCAAAARAGMTPAQACIVWALQRGTVPLPKSVTEARILENASAALGRAGALDAEAMSAIDALNVNHRFVRGDNHAPEGVFWWDMWDEAAPGAASRRLLSQQTAVLDTAQGPWRGRTDITA